MRLPALLLMAVSLLAQRPNTNYDESKAPQYPLPALLDGKAWPERRAEILKLYETHVFGNNITSLAIDTGAYLWSATADGQIQGAPASIFNSVYVGSLGGDIVSFNVDYQGSAGSGNPAWLNAAKSSDIFRVGETCRRLCCCGPRALPEFYVSRHRRRPCGIFAQQNILR